MVVLTDWLKMLVTPGVRHSIPVMGTGNPHAARRGDTAPGCGGSVECMAEALLADIQRILENVAEASRGYRSLVPPHNIELQSRDVAKLKSDMNEKRHRWVRDRAPVSAVRAKCLELGMTAKDTDTIIDLVLKAQTPGRRFVPNRFYRGTSYPYPVE
jgi:hypothetical protein